MKYAALVSVFAFACVSLFAEDISVKPAGEGTEESPYLFDCLENFFWLRQNVLEMDPDVPIYCKQVKDIDASLTQQGGDYAWQTIEFNSHIFAYDGQCYTIFGLEPEEKGALFGTGYLQLKNIRIQGAEGIKTCALAKILNSSSEKKGYFENCHVKGLLVGTPALAGTASGQGVKIEGCVVEAEVEELKGSGALVGRFSGSGICSIKNNCFRGKVIIKVTSAITGLIYHLSPSMNSEINIEDCYAAFNVEIAPESQCHIAGFISNIITPNFATNATANIARCFVSDKIVGQTTVNSKAFIWNASGTNYTLNVRDCYYNESINLSDDYAIPRTDEEMKQRATFEDWDFESIWDIDEGEGTPYLRCELPEPSVVLVWFLLFLFKRNDC